MIHVREDKESKLGPVAILVDDDIEERDDVGMIEELEDFYLANGRPEHLEGWH